MDWNKIKETYPKAWNQLREFHDHRDDEIAWIDYPDVWIIEGMNINGWELRHLYDFFDENEIWIEVSASAINNWGYDIFKLTEDNFLCISENSSYINRKEAEEAAYNKAFEILEQKLK